MKEHDIVQLVNGVDGIPKGSVGTIVSVYEGADVYLVEFEFKSKGLDIENKVMTIHGADLKETQ
jgi:hypothetical protein